MRLGAKTVAQVWERARVVDGLDSDQWRKDECGAWMRREHYAREDSEFGWRIVNVSAGGPDTTENLRPLHWRNAYDPALRRAKCVVTADRTGLPATARTVEPRNRDL